jgi:indole-3-glycerol phosphate synthase
VLSAIVASRRRAVEIQRRRRPRSVIERAIARPANGAAFRRALSPPGLCVIAECKRRSPSKGILRREYDPAALSASYAARGARAISVLTEPSFFDGHLDDLRAVRAAVGLPLLRKDFIVDEYQLVEAAEAGADAVLLIATALDDRALTALRNAAHGLGLAALVEVHDEDDITRAVDCGADIVGVNCRNLRTLSVDPAAARSLIGRIPGTCVAVAESGLRTADDIVSLSRAGYHAFLVGERLVADPDPGAALGELIHEATQRMEQVP